MGRQICISPYSLSKQEIENLSKTTGDFDSWQRELNPPLSWKSKQENRIAKNNNNNKQNGIEDGHL